MFGTCVSYDKIFPIIQTLFYHVTFIVTFDHICKPLAFVMATYIASLESVVKAF